MENTRKPCNKVVKMTKKDRIKYNAFTIFAFCLIIATIFTTNIAISQLQNAQQIRHDTIEKVWREQGRTVLKDLREQFLSDVNSGIVDPYDKDTVVKWADLRLSGVRVGGPTSDGFIIDISNEEVIWNASPDPGNLDFEGDTIYLADTLSSFADPDSGSLAFSQMRQIYSTNSLSNNSWNFDGSPSLLEWIIIPTDGLGFNSTTFKINGVKNPEYKAYLLAVSIQEDEIFKPMAPITLLDETIERALVILNYIVIVSGIFSIFIIVYGDVLRGRSD